jgi:hypothetical protein
MTGSVKLLDALMKIMCLRLMIEECVFKPSLDGVLLDIYLNTSNLHRSSKPAFKTIAWPSVLHMCAFWFARSTCMCMLQSNKDHDTVDLKKAIDTSPELKKLITAPLKVYAKQQSEKKDGNRERPSTKPAEKAKDTPSPGMSIVYSVAGKAADAVLGALDLFIGGKDKEEDSGSFWAVFFCALYV